MALAGQEGSLAVTCCRCCVGRDHGCDGCFCHAGCGISSIVADAARYADPGNGSLVHGGDGKRRVVTEWSWVIPEAPYFVIDNSRFAGTHRYGVGAALSDAFVRASLSKNILPWARRVGALYRCYIATDSIAKFESG